MKIRAEAASLNDVTILKSFSEDQLKKLTETSTGVPVTLEFDRFNPIGKITKAEVLKGSLFVEAEVTEDISGKFLVPGFMLPEYKCTMFGVTETPEDKTLTKIFLC